MIIIHVLIAGNFSEPNTRVVSPVVERASDSCYLIDS